jgi:hypothetical protein
MWKSHLCSAGSGRRTGGKFGARSGRRSHGAVYSIGFLTAKVALNERLIADLNGST